MSETCQEQVYDGGRWPTFHPCGRPVVSDGLCKLHVSVRDRRKARDEASRAERRDVRYASAVYESANNEQAAREAIAELGIEGVPYYRHHFSGSSMGKYTGEIVVSVETLRKLAQR